MRSILLAIVWAASALAVPTGEGLRERQDDNHWVVTWTSMPQEVEPGNLPPPPFTFHTSIGASRLRVQLSNIFGGSDLPITAASLALPLDGAAGVPGIDTKTLKGLTFSGSPSVTVKQGAMVYSDPIDFTIAAQTNIALSL
ncbi:hypothetical protein COL922a_011561 [Colletotrichum nupharicola]|nr:hypothetical protein COL922a_011561 [Colletotrichum nupharicola]